MAKLEIEFELTGLKLKIKGDSDEASGKVADLQRQVQGLMNTIGTLTQGATTPALPPAPPAAQNGTPAPKLLDVVPEPSGNGRKSVGNRGSRRGSTSARQKADPGEFKHDAQKYGFPKQEWNTATKAMWMIHMLHEQTEHKEVSAPVIAETFNKYFREFGKILHNNVTRDLSALKSKGKSVNNDPDKDPQTWYLLGDGKRDIAALIAAPAAEAKPETA